MNEIGMLIAIIAAVIGSILYGICICSLIWDCYCYKYKIGRYKK